MLELQVKSESLRSRLQHIYAFRNNFLADPVSSDNRDLVFTICERFIHSFILIDLGTISLQVHLAFWLEKHRKVPLNAAIRFWRVLSKRETAVGLIILEQKRPLMGAASDRVNLATCE
jgi:hypothetical protein